MLLVVAVLGIAGIESIRARRVEAFVREFIVRAGSGTDAYRRFTAPESEPAVRELRRWNTPEPPVVRCKPLGLPSFSARHECAARFTNGSIAYLDVVDGRGSKTVAVWQVTPPPPGQRTTP